MNKAWERLFNGLIKENPTFVLTLGMCPTLAVTTSAMNGAGMGLSTTVVLILSNVFISLLRKIIPNRVRIPAFIVIIASFVTIVQLLLQGYVPSLYDSLGIYIPLIVVNCIILGRAEAYAYSNPVLPSMFDGFGMGLGFTMALTLIGACRELLGAGQIFGVQLLGPGNVFYQVDSLKPLAMMLEGYVNINIFIMAPGAFFVLAFIIALMNRIKRNADKKAAKKAVNGAETTENVAEEAVAKEKAAGCNSDCAHCGDTGCGHRFYDPDAPVERPSDAEEEKKEKKNKKKNKKKKAEETPEVTTEAAMEETAETTEETVEETPETMEKPEMVEVENVETQEAASEPLKVAEAIDLSEEKEEEGQ